MTFTETGRILLNYDLGGNFCMLMETWDFLTRRNIHCLRTLGKQMPRGKKDDRKYNYKYPVP